MLLQYVPDRPKPLFPRRRGPRDFSLALRAFTLFPSWCQNGWMAGEQDRHLGAVWPAGARGRKPVAAYIGKIILGVELFIAAACRCSASCAPPFWWPSLLSLLTRRWPRTPAGAINDGQRAGDGQFQGRGLRD